MKRLMGIDKAGAEEVGFFGNVVAFGSDDITLRVHAGALKGHDPVRSSPEPYSFPHFYTSPSGQNIDIAVADISLLRASVLRRVAWIIIRDAGKKIRRVPDLVWTAPNLRSLTVPGELVGDLFKKGLPSSVRELAIESGCAIKITSSASFPNVRLLHNVRDHLSFVDFDTSIFPEIGYLELNLGSKEAKRERWRTWEIICSYQALRGLALWYVHSDLAFGQLPRGLTELSLDGGNIEDLGFLRQFQELEYLELRFLRDIKSIEVLKDLPAVKEIFILTCPAIESYRPLLDMPRLRRVRFLESSDPAVAKALHAKGVDVPGWPPPQKLGG